MKKDEGFMEKVKLLERLGNTTDGLALLQSIYISSGFDNTPGQYDKDERFDPVATMYRLGITETYRALRKYMTSELIAKIEKRSFEKGE